MMPIFSAQKTNMVLENSFSSVFGNYFDSGKR
jgi:hypothetical protein